jgi:hypothetical protein
VIDGDEDVDLTLLGPGRGHVGAPHRVHRVLLVGAERTSDQDSDHPGAS